MELTTGNGNGIWGAVVQLIHTYTCISVFKLPLRCLTITDVLLSLE